MNTLLLEHPAELAPPTDLPQDPFVIEGAPSGPESASGLSSSELSPRSDLAEGIGGAAITLASGVMGTEVRDERGNILPVYRDLREVANENPWVLEQGHIARNLGRKVMLGMVEGYRRIPPEVRGKVVSKGHSSDVSLAAIAAGYGFKRGFLHYALSKGMHNAFNPGEPGAWEDILNWS